MDTITLSVTEEQDYQTVKHFAEEHKNIRRLAVELSCSEKTARRYAVGYIQEGRAYFVHGNHGKTSPRRIPDETRQYIVSLFCNKYSGATYVHFMELIADNENLNFSEAFIRTLLRHRFLLSPKATKATRKAVKRELRRLQESATPEAQKELAAQILALDEAHPTRPRKKYFGELLQTDASEHLWFGEEKTALHIAVDDSTSRIVGAYFDVHETLVGYFRMTEQILIVYGIPATFLADNRTVFTPNAKADDRPDRKTQFGYMCKNLGIEIRTTSVAQAKGRVERMWDTLQNRLPLEMKLAGIKTIDEANAFLSNYISHFNEKFGLPVHAEKSVFIPSPSNDEIRLFLSVLTERKIDGGSSLRFEHNRYATVSDCGERVFLAKKTTGIVARTLDNALFFTAAGTTYALEPIPEHEPLSLNFDPIPPISTIYPRKILIPPKNHSWQLEIYKKFLDKVTNA